MRHDIITFIGIGDTAEIAVRDADAQARNWLFTHQWHTHDGRSAYTATSTLAATEGGYTYVLHLFGPIDPTREG